MSQRLGRPLGPVDTGKHGSQQIRNLLVVVKLASYGLLSRVPLPVLLVLYAFVRHLSLLLELVVVDVQHPALKTDLGVLYLRSLIRSLVAHKSKRELVVLAEHKFKRLHFAVAAEQLNKLLLSDVRRNVLHVQVAPPL